MRDLSSTALLPTATNINLFNAEENKYFASHNTYLVLRSSRGGKLTIASTYAGVDPTAGHWIGERFDAHHDQSGYHFGLMTVVGMRTREGKTFGEIPNRKLALRVFK